MFPESRPTPNVPSSSSIHNPLTPPAFRLRRICDAGTLKTTEPKAMDNVSAIPARIQRISVIAASHEVFPVQRTERIIRDPQTGRSISYDHYDLSPQALAKARERYKASECYLCPDCENTHGPGQCGLDPVAIEVRSDFDPGPIHPRITAAAWFLIGAATAWLVVGLIF